MSDLFQILGVDNGNMLPTNLGQINYKASLLHLQPRQMRLEITDLKDDDDDPEVEWKKTPVSEFYFDNWMAEDSSEDEEEEEGEDGEADQFKINLDDDLQPPCLIKTFEDKAVSMQDDILTAVKEEPIIAPLPTRLSFCLSPKQVKSVVEEIQAAAAVVEDVTTTSNDTPTRQLVAKRSPTVAPSVVRLRNEQDSLCHGGAMRSSISCDNYLGEVASCSTSGAIKGAKNSLLEDLSENESVTTPSPLRWAAKAEVVLTTPHVNSREFYCKELFH